MTKSALIIIDMQRDFLEPNGYAANAGMDIKALRKPISNILRLLTIARKKELLIVYTREGHRPDMRDCPPAKLARSRNIGEGQVLCASAEIGRMGTLGRLLIRGEFGHDIIDELKPIMGEPVIDKPGYGAFYQTDLAQILSNHNIQELYICGVTTEVCVHSTLREAVDRGYECVLVSDACGSAHDDLHAAAIQMVAVEGGIFGRALNTQLAIALLEKNYA